MSYKSHVANSMHFYDKISNLILLKKETLAEKVLKINTSISCNFEYGDIQIFFCLRKLYDKDEETPLLTH